MRAAIRLAGGREVCFVCTLDEDAVLRTARVAARGDVQSVLALPGFAQPGEMLVHNHPSGVLGGAPAVLTKLEVDMPMAGPDGLRSIGGNRFLQAEGTAGRITLLTISGDKVTTVVLKEGLQSSPGVTLVGNTAYAVEGKINYLFDAKLRGQDPGPFKAIAIPLPR